MEYERRHYRTRRTLVALLSICGALFSYTIINIAADHDQLYKDSFGIIVHVPYTLFSEFVFIGIALTISVLPEVFDIKTLNKMAHWRYYTNLFIRVAILIAAVLATVFYSMFIFAYYGGPFELRFPYDRYGLGVQATVAIIFFGYIMNMFTNVQSADYPQERVSGGGSQ
jgi:hypothetical protein